jgi:hypothetical protein
MKRSREGWEEDGEKNEEKKKKKKKKKKKNALKKKKIKKKKEKKKKNNNVASKSEFRNRKPRLHEYQTQCMDGRKNYTQGAQGNEDVINKRKSKKRKKKKKKSRTYVSGSRDFADGGSSRVLPGDGGAPAGPSRPPVIAATAAPNSPAWSCRSEPTTALLLILLLSAL